MVEGNRVERTGLPEDDEISALLHAIAQKDAVAMERLDAYIRRSVFAMAYAQIRDQQLAEDATQETLFYIWNHADDYRQDHHPKGWVFLIARHMAIDFVRKRRDEISLDESDERSWLSDPRTSTDPIDALSLREGIDSLDPIESQVFVLKAVVGLRHSEIALLIGISIRSSKYRYRNAVRALRTLLAADLTQDQEKEV